MKTRHLNRIQHVVSMRLHQSPAGIAVMSLLLLLSVPGQVQGQGALVNGGNHSGIITTNDPSDSWTFSANAGETIWLRLGTMPRTCIGRLFQFGRKLLAELDCVV